MAVALLTLGIGSFIFHATLQKVTEFFDKLSMLVLTWSMLDKSLALGQSPASAILISFGLAIFHIGFGISYVISTQLLYHVAIFVT